MADTTFVDRVTVISQPWAQDINDHVYNNTPITPAVTVHPASVIANTPAGNIAATTVQAAINELDTEKAPVASPTFTGTVGGVTGAMVSNTPAGNIAATTVQAALNELDTEKAQLTTLAAVGGAALIGNTPAGNIAATTVQAALNELDTEKALLAGSASQVFSVSSATAAVHAVPAAQIQARAVTAFTTAGTSTAYTLTPSPAITSYATNQTWDVTFNSTCGLNPTLTVSGLATPPSLVRQNMDGTYATLSASSFPSGWNSEVKMVSATQALVLRLPETETTTYATTLSSGSGTLTSAAATMSIIKSGRNRSVFFSVVITTNGTAATSIRLTVPEATANYSVGVTREISVTGTMGMSYMATGTSTILLYTATGTYPGADGYTIVGNIEYYI